MQAHRIGASHEEARNALRLKGSDRGRLDGHEKTRSFTAKFANSFCNRQANLPSAFATSQPERSRRASASRFPDDPPPPRIFESSGAAAFLGMGWRRFRPDALKFIHGNLHDSRRTGRSSADRAARIPYGFGRAEFAGLSGFAVQISRPARRRLPKISSSALSLSQAARPR
jgi:hypothetical protein